MPKVSNFIPKRKNSDNTSNVYKQKRPPEGDPFLVYAPSVEVNFKQLL